MAERRTRRAAAKRSSVRPRRDRRRAPAKTGFVGRDPSPVLDRYPPKTPEFRTPVRPTTEPVSAPPSPAVTTESAPPTSLIRLDRPFDLDEFSQMLGETSIRIKVPREDLLEVLRRVTDFMGFGVYVYAISVRPVDSAALKEFEVDLQRIDFSGDTSRWQPFVERGAVSPYDGDPGA